MFSPRTRPEFKEDFMAKKQSQRRGKSGNASGRTVKEATGGLKKRHGWAGGKHPKNRLFVGPRQRKQLTRKRRPRAGY
jgi:hypothetical protein